MVSRTTITSKPRLKGIEPSWCLNFLAWKVWIRGLNQRTITNPKNLKEQRFGWHLITNLVGFRNVFCDIWYRATGWITLVKGTWKTWVESYLSLGLISGMRWGEVAQTKHGHRLNIGSRYRCSTSCQHINTKKVCQNGTKFLFTCTYSTNPKINEIAISVAPKQLILRSHTHWLSPMDETANQGLEGCFFKKSLREVHGFCPYCLLINLSIQCLL